MLARPLRFGSFESSAIDVTTAAVPTRGMPTRGSTARPQSTEVSARQAHHPVQVKHPVDSIAVGEVARKRTSVFERLGQSGAPN